MFTRKELAECAAREVEKRREVYGRMIAARKMRPLVAQHHIDLLRSLESSKREELKRLGR